MKTRIGILLSAVGLLLVTTTVLAHHSFAAEFDSTKAVNLKGTITRVEWMNPHIWFYLDVKNADGTMTNWGFSGGPPGLLTRHGIRKETLVVGTVITVSGFRAKDGSNNASAGMVTFADGRNVFAGSPEDVVPSQKK